MQIRKKTTFVGFLHKISKYVESRVFNVMNCEKLNWIYFCNALYLIGSDGSIGNLKNKIRTLKKVIICLETPQTNNQKIENNLEMHDLKQLMHNTCFVKFQKLQHLTSDSKD